MNYIHQYLKKIKKMELFEGSTFQILSTIVINEDT